MIIIGSTAIRRWFPDFPREPKDVDIVLHHLEKGCDTIIRTFFPGKRVEFLVNDVLAEHFHGSILEPNELYTLKVSHLFYDINWEKHLFDVQFLKEKRCRILMPLFYELYNYWGKIHGKNKRSNLNMSSKDFFDNAVNFPVQHDHLHELLIQHKYFNGQEKPTYSKILKDGQEVDVSMTKFLALTEQEKYNVVFEEVAVMGIERFPETEDYRRIYARMLKKFIISHCKIEEALWIIENYKQVVKPAFDFKEFLYLKIKEKKNDN